MQPHAAFFKKVHDLAVVSLFRVDNLYPGTHIFHPLRSPRPRRPSVQAA